MGDKEYYRSIYNINQLQELEADIASLVRPEYREKEYIEILQGALIWFVSLALAERAQNIINPSSNERYNYILENVKIPHDFNLKYIEKVKENAKILGSFWKRICQIITIYMIFMVHAIWINPIVDGVVNS